jgi:hypothetical protein
MKKLMLVTLSLILVSVFFAGSASPATAKEPKLMEFDTMEGVPSTLTGTQASAAFRNVNAGGAPWTLTSAKGELTTSGHLEIEVVGLVLTNTGLNPSANFRGLVSCIKSDGTVENILTANFPATTGSAASGGGNAKIEADLVLPQPCFAPIVFVTSAAGNWFAVTGN